MKAHRIAVLFTITIVVSAGLIAYAQGRGRGANAPSPYSTVSGKAYKFEKIAEGVYYATSTGSMATGSNNPVIVGDRDVMVVDTGTSPAAARALMEDLKVITDKPVRCVVNTHFHYDHTDGNQVYAGHADIIAHEYVKYAIEKLDVLHREPYKTSQLTNVPNRIESLKKQLAEEQDAARKATLERQLSVAQEGWDALKEIKPTPPNKTYAKRMAIKVGRHDVQLLFLGRGHTNGDTVVYLPQERIVVTGDLMESGLAYMGDAQFDEWVTTLDALKKLELGYRLARSWRPVPRQGARHSVSGLPDGSDQAGDRPQATWRVGRGCGPARRSHLTQRRSRRFSVPAPTSEVCGACTSGSTSTQSADFSRSDSLRENARELSRRPRRSASTSLAELEDDSAAHGVSGGASHCHFGELRSPGHQSSTGDEADARESEPG